MERRREHASVTFNGSMYIIGGFAVDEETKVRGYRNDVYKSTDGNEWTLVSQTNGWNPRMNHSVVVSGDKMYLFGGMQNGITYFDDMWESEDGITWSQVVGGTLVGKRSSMGVAVDDDGVIYLIGGSYPNATPHDNGAADPESGLDETDWRRLWSYDPHDAHPVWNKKAHPSCSTSQRAEFSLGYIDNKLILLPGKSNTSFWFSRGDNLFSIEVHEHSTWSTDSAGPPIPPRYSYSSVVFPIDGEDFLFIIGGIGDRGPENDVYKGNFGGTL